ncbi:MAG: hypothetical protein HYX21_01985 [Candidatus Yanofskybacteria bacterium]|nr:hypothetical protein [Candidatus Yanofskybacteria bacterium]
MITNTWKLDEDSNFVQDPIEEDDLESDDLEDDKETKDPEKEEVTEDALN